MRKTILRIACFTALLILAASGCTSAPSPQVQDGPTAKPQVLAGGCANTVVTQAEPPAWALGGFTQATGTPWTLPWAQGTGGDAVAFLFARQLVAGASPRVDGTTNKVLWVAKGNPSNLVVEGVPPGATEATFTVNGGPSIVDVPTAGCWTFQLKWGQAGTVGSTFHLNVLPAGTMPPPPAA
ncbi:MAG TPA: hypothetical protein VNF91_07300 [Candidatus Acidoferrum sp.]|nr:hypothetical protein [Candidatus Acidoferrum sp.]